MSSRWGILKTSRTCSQVSLELPIGIYKKKKKKKEEREKKKEEKGKERKEKKGKKNNPRDNSPWSPSDIRRPRNKGF